MMNSRSLYGVPAIQFAMYEMYLRIPAPTSHTPSEGFIPGTLHTIKV